MVSGCCAGSVAVKVVAGDTVTVARTLKEGESFGELALLQRGGRRAATVVTTSPTEFLTIAADHYEELLSKLHHQEIMAKVEAIRPCRIFRCVTGPTHGSSRPRCTPSLRTGNVSLSLQAPHVSQD
jgi:hypothetical protein